MVPGMNYDRLKTKSTNKDDDQASQASTTKPSKDTTIVKPSQDTSQTIQEDPLNILKTIQEGPVPDEESIKQKKQHKTDEPTVSKPKPNPKPKPNLSSTLILSILSTAS